VNRERPLTVSEMQCLRLQIEDLQRAFEAGLKAVSMALQTLDDLEGHNELSCDLDDTAAIDRTTALRRARGGPGGVSKLDADPELQSFVRARIHAQTYDEIVGAVAAQFPTNRRTSRSAIARWWLKQRPGKDAQPPANPRETG